MTRGKLLHIVGASKFGGDSVLVIELGKAARERGYEVDILTTDPVFQERVVAEGLGLVDLDVVRREIRPLWDFRGWKRLKDFLAGSDYAIVHTHTSKPGVVGRHAAWKAGVPGILHTVHGFGFHEESGALGRALFVNAERLAARWCHRIVTVSEFHRGIALDLGIGTAEQVIAIPNGVPLGRASPSRSREDIRSALGVSDDFVIVSTGRLAEQKGLEYLIRAVPLVRPDVPGLKVLLAGDGPLRRHLATTITGLGVQDSVQLLGFRRDIADLLHAADLIALPSLWEGLSISLLEAMAAEKAVITTSIGSNVEVTDGGKTAVLVPPKDPVALADAIKKIAGDPQRRGALAREAKLAQSERYSLSRMLGCYMEEYDRLLAPAASRT